MKTYIYIGAGGFAGAVVRYLVKGLSADGADFIIPVHTLTVNLLGAFALAFILTAALELRDFDADLRLGLSAGMMGALTTFSTLCRETVELMRAGSAFEAVSYMLLSVLAGFVCAWGGMHLARKLGRTLRKKPENQNGTFYLESDETD